MPRPNRYHPYIRQQNTAPSSNSPRYPLPPTHRIPPGMPPMAEQSSGRPYQYIFPGYIRATTSDGKALMAKQILQGADGIFHIQMQLVRFPSEDVRQHMQFQQSQAQAPPPCLPAPLPMPFPIDPALAGVGIKREVQHSPVSPDGRRHGSIDSRFSSSSSSGASECAIVSEGEDEEEEGTDGRQMRAIREQKRIMEVLALQKRQIRAGIQL